MNKWITNLVTTLIILALTSLVSGLLKGPIDDFVNRDKLKSQVQLAPWIEKPELSAAQKVVEEDESEGAKTSDQILDKLLRDLESIRYSSGGADDFGVARVNIENDSAASVENINFRLDSPYSEQEVLLIDAEGKAVPLGLKSRVSIPDMSPGDRVTVYMWGNYSNRLFADRFKTYSSEGPFRISFDWPTTQEFRYESGISKFIDEYALTVGFVAGITLLLMMIVVASVQDDYIKKVLKESEAYNHERKRYLADPKKFSFDIAAVGKIAGPTVENDEDDPSDDDNGTKSDDAAYKT